MLNSFQINEGIKKYVQFGSKIIDCTVYSTDEHHKDEVILSYQAWEALQIPSSLWLSLKQMDTHLYFGPIIGIFTSGFTNHFLRPVGERSLLFAKYIDAAKSKGALAIIFGIPHIQWDEEVINGYTFTKTGWKEIRVPFPNVIYDRLPNRKTEAQPTHISARKKLINDYQIPWFNPGFFDKSTIYKQLLHLPEIKQYLPEMITSPSKEKLEQFVHQYRYVYVKPKNGSLGLGIHQLYFDEMEGFYYCRFRDRKQNRLRRYSSLFRLLNVQFPNGLDNMIVQEGISLLKYQNNPIDFRVHTNKDEEGIWKVSALAAKISGSGSVTTHVKSGGQIKTVQEIWEDLNLNKQLFFKLKEVAILLSIAIEETTMGSVGEIGFDLGIDTEENIWMFEANSKPGRTIFTHPKLKVEDHLTRKMPMDYAIYLFEESLRQHLINEEETIFYGI